jgi:hypothetical protein
MIVRGRRSFGASIKRSYQGSAPFSAASLREIPTARHVCRSRALCSLHVRNSCNGWLAALAECRSRAPRRGYLLVGTSLAPVTVTMAASVIPIERITSAILVLRGQRVLLDSSLAAMYSVTTKVLNQAVRRNRKRFPPDFMFQLTAAETAILRSQIVTSRSHGGRRHRPRVFTEQGVAMLSSVLKSERAIAVNIEIMRAFVQLRSIARSHIDLSKKLDELERKYDRRFKSVFDAIRYLMNPPARTARTPIGFRTPAMSRRSTKLVSAAADRTGRR